MADTYDQGNDLTGFWNAVLQADTRAYARIHGHLHPVLYRYALAMLGAEELAEDAVQEVFIRIWYRKEQIGPLNSVRAFFFTAIRRQALNQLRGLRNLQILPAKEPDIGFSPEDILIEQEDEAERKTKISQYLNQLSRRQREVIYLRFYEELSYTEIADIMQVNYQSVINLAHKAITQLRGLMGHIPLWWLVLVHLR